MQRDMDLIRKLLLYLEAKPDDRVKRSIEIEGYDPALINYHLVLLANARLIDFEASRSTSNPDRLIEVFPTRLTWEGHEFLDAARDQTVWDRVKTDIGDRFTRIPLEVLKALLVDYIKKQLMGDQ